MDEQKVPSTNARDATDRRGSDRRVNADPGYAGPERRTGDRRGSR